jgi:uncharacterized protein (TIGR01777 family)
VSATTGKVLVSGVSGPIGAALLPSLKERGYQITRLVRGAKSGGDQIAWDPAQPLRPQSVSGFDAVIHLAGESVVGRWSAAKKRRILDSRVQGTRHLAEALAEAPQRPQVLISASATGYYGDRGEEVLTEDSPPGKGFLPEVCREWEAAAQPAEEAGIRTLQMRIGLVLSPAGGALQKMLTPFRMGLGGNMGNGRQWWSWIDVQDLVGGIQHILRGNLAGAVNLVAPEAVTNAEFTKTLAAVLHRPAIFPMPAFAARLVFGQMGDELLLASQKVQPAKLVASGYSFRHSDLTKALQNILKQ